MINTEHKDRVFKFIFGNPEHKHWTLSLYNAINGTNYQNPDDIEFNTIEDALYLGMKNDISFILILLNVLNMWEHQSTFNPNMPIRLFIYAARLYDKYITSRNLYKYSRNLITLPKPKCVCFYNGTKDQPEEIILSLSEAFGVGETDIEVKVRMLNINYGKNIELMEACKPLNEYAWLVDRIRAYNETDKDIEIAVNKALDEMPDDFVIKEFLLAHRAEVKGMFLTEYDEEKTLQQERQEGIQEANERVAMDMLRENYPLAAIKKISTLSESTIRNMANALGLVIS